MFDRFLALCRDWAVEGYYSVVVFSTALIGLWRSRRVRSEIASPVI